LSLKGTVFEIFDFKYAVTLKTGLGVRQGHWKYHPSIERILLTSYWRSIVYLVSFLRYSMSKNMTLKSGSDVTQGHRKLYYSTRRPWLPINVP